jgi:hypothetical protein
MDMPLVIFCLTWIVDKLWLEEDKRKREVSASLRGISLFSSSRRAITILSQIEQAANFCRTANLDFDQG